VMGDSSGMRIISDTNPAGSTVRLFRRVQPLADLRARPNNIARTFKRPCFQGPFHGLLEMSLVGARGFEPPTPRSRTDWPQRLSGMILRFLKLG